MEIINKEKLKEIISNFLNCPIEHKQTCNWREMGIDSITYVKMLVCLENQLDLELEDYFLDLENFISFDDFVDKLIIYQIQVRAQV